MRTHCSERSRIGAGAKGGAVALVLALATTACGSGAHPAAHPAAHRSRASRPAAGGLAQFLVSQGEEPGFTVNPSQTMHTLQALVDLAGGTSAQTASAIKRYTAERFRAAALEHTAGSGGAQGVSNVIEFATAAGARKELAHLLHPPGASARFPVTAIPIAAGLAEGNAKEGSAANVVWVEGRCTMLVGYFRAQGTARRQPVIKAAEAVYRRTHGTCP